MAQFRRPLDMSLVRIFIQFFRRKDGSCNEKFSSSCSVTDSELSLYVKGMPLPGHFLGPTANGDHHTSNAHSATPHAIYDGGFPDAHRRGICIRIANGGAGQAGLIKAWADAFVKDMVARGSEPFQIAWYLGDTTDSLSMLASGAVDFALTYNAAAEAQSVNSGIASDRVYAFRDHFILVGPIHNPADLEDDDDILTMFNKIVTSGNYDVLHPPGPDDRPATRFLSRFDKSATNIKESQLFVMIGQVPWALGQSKWYHQYPRFPQEAIRAASLLSEYTLTDRGTWLTTPKSITSQLRIYKTGSDDAEDLLLNPAHLLYGSQTPAAPRAEICRVFLDWIVSATGGQNVIENFLKQGDAVYSKAP